MAVEVEAVPLVAVTIQAVLLEGLVAVLLEETLL